ncbi:MAG: hypothetical protein K6F69_00435, partial [Treponema sp.]|nr:hypothetical protein [Treponema sp.]
MTIEELQEELTTKLSNPVDITISIKGEKILLSKNENGYFALSFFENNKNVKFRLVQTSPELISYEEHILPVENLDSKILVVTCIKDNRSLALSLINNEAKKDVMDSSTAMKETEENIWIET